MSKKRHTTKPAAPNLSSRRRPKDRPRNLIGLWVGVGIVIVAAAAFLLFRPRQALPTEVSVAQAYEKYQAGAFFLDIRPLEEWNQGHIAKSVLIPLDELPNRSNEVPRDQDVVVVCRSGARSKEGATILRQAGFTRVTCMSGGLQVWAAAGYPIE